MSFREFELPAKLRIDDSVLDRWLVMMEANYLDANPYHNSTHAADVLAVSRNLLMINFNPLYSGNCFFSTNRAMPVSSV